MTRPRWPPPRCACIPRARIPRRTTPRGFGWGGVRLTPTEALLVSLTAIHGRVFFTQFGLDNMQAWVAAGESVAGIVIEGTFVAMLVQRFFGR